MAYSSVHQACDAEAAQVPKDMAVKSGTQIIDRCWSFLKLNQNSKVGSHMLKCKVRSAQYEYWLKNQDLWVATGDLCRWSFNHHLSA